MCTSINSLLKYWKCWEKSCKSLSEISVKAHRIAESFTCEMCGFMNLLKIFFKYHFRTIHESPKTSNRFKYSTLWAFKNGWAVWGSTVTCPEPHNVSLWCVGQLKSPLWPVSSLATCLCGVWGCHVLLCYMSSTSQRVSVVCGAI